MPILTVEGFSPVDVEAGKRLVNAIEQDAGVDILHACGGNARCTTCRIEFISGEPARMTKAEQTKLAEKGLTGVRLSCQITCDQDMLSITRSATCWLARNEPLCLSSASTSVVLPWSTCAMIATLRRRGFAICCDFRCGDIRPV